MNSTVSYKDLLQMSKEEINTFVTQLGLPFSDLPSFLTNVKSRYGDKPYCVVGDWEWREQVIPMRNDNSLKIFYVYADYVIADEQQRYAPGSWARSSPLTALHDKCVFETANTLYILVNRDIDEQSTREK